MGVKKQTTKMKKSELRNIIRESINQLIEGPGDCYFKYHISTTGASMDGFYYGSPSGGGGSFSCASSIQLHQLLGFGSNPNKVVSIKNGAPANPHGFKSNNCIQFEGQFPTPSFFQTQHITDPSVLSGPAFGTTIVDYNSVEECKEDFKFADRHKKYKKYNN